MSRRPLRPTRPDWFRIHRESSLKVYTPLLALFSMLYRSAVTLRLCAYTHGFCKVRSLPGFVVSVGNLTTGGTGKTPAVIALGKWAVQKGYRTAILSRGFGGRRQDDVLEVSDGKEIFCDADMAGDEPFLMARAVPGAAVVIAKKRYRAGQYAHKKFGTQLFILDDGFQHLGLRRDLNVVLMDTVHPFGNGHLLPWGPLREPIRELRRADAMVLTRFTQGAPGERMKAFLNRRFPSIPLFYADHVPKQVVFPGISRIQSPECILSKRVVAFAGIGDPGSFKYTLEKAGAHVVGFRTFRDHYPYSPGDIAALIRMKEKRGADYLITTEKDWVRIQRTSPVAWDLAYLTVAFSFLPESGGIFKMIKAGVKRAKDDL